MVLKWLETFTIFYLIKYSTFTKNRLKNALYHLLDRQELRKQPSKNCNNICYVKEAQASRIKCR